MKHHLLFPHEFKKSFMLIKNHLSAPKSPEQLDERVTPHGKEGV